MERGTSNKGCAEMTLDHAYYWGEKMEKELMDERKHECCNPDCGWIGPESETVTMKHGFPRYLCPECHEVTEKC